MKVCDGVRVLNHRLGAAAIAPLCVLVAGLLAGCSTSDGVGSFIVDPGRYSVYHCDGLAARLKALLVREQELANLMDRASEGGGGVLIGNLSYRADYENAVGEEKLLRRTAAEKKCDLPPPAAPVSPTPAAYTAPPAPVAVPAPASAPIFQSDQTIR
jgi:predicted small secreted protein